MSAREIWLIAKQNNNYDYLLKCRDTKEVEE
jgi:hypothetical protein